MLALSGFDPESTMVSLNLVECIVEINPYPPGYEPGALPLRHKAVSNLRESAFLQ